MPVYEYEGLQTGRRFEVRQGFNDAPLTHDPETGEPVRRVFYPAGIVFKGSGWYITDSRKPEPSTNGTSGDSSAKSTEAKSTAATSSTAAD